MAGSEELYDFFCEPCSNDGQHVQADGYCVNCNEYLCAPCYRCHRKMSVSRHHTLFDLEHMPRDKRPVRSISTPDVCTDPCLTHSDKIVEYFCKPHDQLGCSACMTISHRTCTGVSFIPDIADGIETSQEFKALIKKIKDLEASAAKGTSTAQNNAVLVDTYGDEAISRVREARQEINELFDKLEKDMCLKVNAIKSQDSAAMKVVCDEFDSVKHDLNVMATDIESKQKNKQQSQVFVAMKNTEKKMKTLEDKVKNVSNDNKIRQYTFEPGREILAIKNSPATLGNLTMVSDKVDIASVHRRPDKKTTPKADPTGKYAPTTDVTKAKPLKTDTKSRKATLHGNINVKSNNIKPPSITGMVLLSNDQLAAADTDNYTIKLIDIKHNKITSELKTSCCPWDITEVTKVQLAVTLPYIERIQFVAVSKTLSTTHDIKVEGTCQGIVHDQGRLIVIFSAPPKLEIMDTTGTVLKRFTTDNKGKQLFITPWYLTLSLDKNTIYVSDAAAHTVTSLTMYGQVQATYSGDTVSGAYGLTIDKHGLVYMCNYGLRKIHQLTPDCTQVQVLLCESDELGNPYSVEYCANEDKLYVGMQFSDSIKVFKLH